MRRNIPEPLGGDHHTTVAHRGIQIGFATSSPQCLAVRWRDPARLRWRWSRAESTLWMLRDVARRLWTKCGWSHIDKTPGPGQTDH